MIDLHCHVLPGLDDGPATLEEALALLADEAEAGVDTVVATSHVNSRWSDVTAEAIAAGVERVAAAAADAGLGVRVLRGAEVALTRATDMADAELEALRLGDGPWLLVEPPLAVWSPSALEAAVTALLERGHRLVLAHPERCPALRQEPAVVGRLVERGVLCSVTASALDGAFGRAVRRFALDLLGAGLVHDVASDAHAGTASRRAGLVEHLVGTGYDSLAGWLCEDVPRAIVTGAEVPPRPAPPSRRRPRGVRLRVRRR